MHFNKAFKTKFSSTHNGGDRGSRPRDFLCMRTELLFRPGTSQKSEFEVLVQKQSVYFLFLKIVLKSKLASFSYIIERAAMTDLIPYWGGRKVRDPAVGYNTGLEIRYSIVLNKTPVRVPRALVLLPTFAPNIEILNAWNLQVLLCRYCEIKWLFWFWNKGK